MIGFNEKQEILNIWEISQECKRLFEKYFLFIDENKIQEAFLQELNNISPDSEITIQDNPVFQKIAASWWVMRILGQYRKLRYSGKYAIDFTSDSKGRQQGLQHLADSLASPVLHEQQAGSVIPPVVSGRWATKNKSSKKGIVSTPADEFLPLIYDELLQDLTSEQKEIVAQSYSRMLYMDDMHNFLHGAYRLDQAIKKSIEEWKMYCSSKQKPNDDMQEIMSDLYVNLHDILSLTSSSQVASDLEKEYRKQQQFDIYDNQIRYLERIARGYSTADASCDDWIAIPSVLFSFDAESILLAAVLYRQMSLRNNGEYSEDYWIIPGMYQSTFGIYGNSSVMPARYFDNVAKSVKASAKKQPSKEHPIEQIATVCGFTMIKLRRSAWDAFESVNSNVVLPVPDKNADSQEPKITAEDILTIDDAVWYLLKKEWDNIQSLENKAVYSTEDDSKTLGIKIHDNGGTEAYEMISGYLKQKKETKAPIRDTPQEVKDIYHFFAEKADALSTDRRLNAIAALISLAIEQFSEAVTSRETLFSGNWPVKLLNGRKGWQQNAIKVFFAYLCWLQPTVDGKKSISADAATFSNQFATAIKGIQDDDCVFQQFRNDILQKEYRLHSRIVEETDTMEIYLTETVKSYLADISIHKWLFEDGEIPEWTDAKKQTVKMHFQSSMNQLIASNSGMENKERLSRRITGTASSEDKLIRILFAYHANTIQNNDNSCYIIWPVCEDTYSIENWRYMPVCRGRKAVSPDVIQNSTRPIIEMCEDIWGKGDVFEQFLNGIGPKKNMHTEELINCKLFVEYFGLITGGRRNKDDRERMISKYKFLDNVPFFKVRLQYKEKNT